ncbi:hypothetical protein U1Q18_030607 [Sarracenia purpurea var. burkii]
MMGENSQLGSPLMENHPQTADTADILRIWTIFRGISRGGVWISRGEISRFSERFSEFGRFSEGFREVGCGFRDFQRDSPNLSNFQKDFGGGTRRSKLETRLLYCFGGLKVEADWIP